MAFSVPPLPYGFDALEPHIDAKTMEIHHDKHHQAYVTNLNAALEGTEWTDRPIEAVLASLEIIPEDKRTAVRNNGGGHANHTLFWEIMSPDGGGEPSGELAEAIDSTFDSFDELKKLVNDAGVKRFGSGMDLAHLGRHRPRRQVDTQPGHSAHGFGRAAARDRRLGARVLPQLPEQAPGLPRGMVERRELGRRRCALRGRELIVVTQTGEGAACVARSDGFVARAPDCLPDGGFFPEPKGKNGVRA